MTDENGYATDGGAGSLLSRDDDTGEADETPASDGVERSHAATASEFAGEDLVIGYPSADSPVVDGESIRVPPGEVTALVGPNGSGKSTLLKGLADQLSLDRGTVRVDGAAVHELGAKQLARKLGLLSQDNTAPTTITVQKLVAHGRYPYRGAFGSLADADREAIDRAIEMAGVDHLRDREVGSLSGGQQQLAWIAMALAQETDVLLLDEPTTFLDLRHQLQVMEIVERLRDESETTVVLVLHDIEQAAQYADHVVALEGGAIYARGPPESVVTEDLLADVFGVDAAVASTEHGPQVTPLRPLADGGDGNETGESDGATE